MLDEIRGRVGRIVFCEGSYHIFQVDIDGAGQATAKGQIYGLVQLKPGVTLKLEGTWKDHNKYGRQFAVRTWEPWAQDADDVAPFLYTCVEGFTEAMAEGVATLADPFEAMEANMGVLTERLGEDTAQAALLAWTRALATRDLSGLLSAGGLHVSEIQAAMDHFGTEAAALIRANPYRLMEVPGLSFPRVDRFAVKAGASLSSPRRVEGVILWALKMSLNEGHLFLPRGKLSTVVNGLMKTQMVALPPVGEAAFEEATERLVEREALKFETGCGVYLPTYHEYERETAKLLIGLLAPSDIDLDIAAFLADYERSNHITFSPDQRAAAESLGQHRVLVLTGLPGTGKTTTVRALVRLFEESQTSFALMAPTGIAAKRLAAVAGHPASTIHRALKYNGSAWGHDKRNRFVVDAIIVDEMSMVDQELAYRLLSALRPETMLVLVGDDAQLPSVGAGNVLRELIASEHVPSIRLTQIFRQSEKGEIVINSHRIFQGEMPELVDPRTETEFKFIRMSDEEAIADLIVKMSKTLKEKNANFQVLSPKYKGEVGVDNLNQRLRDALNPPGPMEWSRGDQHFRVGDRLMIVRNDYKRNVYNGDVGKLVRATDDSVTVRVHGVIGGSDTEVEFDPAAAEEKLRLAYAVTVHKSQGNEFNTIIMPIFRTQGRMLQRNLLYTAVTRARKQVWLLGEEMAVQRAISNNKVVERNTALAEALDHVARGGDGGL